MYERFTDRSKRVMKLAEQVARRVHQNSIGSEHIIWGLIQEGSGVASTVLDDIMGIRAVAVEAEIKKLIVSSSETNPEGELPKSDTATQSIEYAREEARALKHIYIGTEHLLLGVLRDPTGIPVRILSNMAIKPEDVRTEVLDVLGYDRLGKLRSVP